MLHNCSSILHNTRPDVSDVKHSLSEQDVHGSKPELEQDVHDSKPELEQVVHGSKPKQKGCDLVPLLCSSSKAAQHNLGLGCNLT